jgi:hypothetical protein
MAVDDRAPFGQGPGHAPRTDHFLSLFVLGSRRHHDSAFILNGLVHGDLGDDQQ